jgi:hypothetical protein
VRDGDERFGIERSEKLDIKKKSKVRHSDTLPAKSRSRFLLPISSRQIEESISIAEYTEQ